MVGAALVLALASGAALVASQPEEPFPPVKIPLIIPRMPSVPLNESVLRIPMTVSSPSGVQHLTLEATLYRPSGPGPFPLLVLSHGTPRSARLRQGERLRYNAQSWEFVSMGFAVVIPMRRGYGKSAGSYAEEEGFCDQALFYEAGMASAKDLRATLHYMAAQPFIDSRRIVLAGHSSGGFASLAMASQGFPGLKGVISFGGGRGSMQEKNCSPGHLIEACARFGRTCRVPTLWVYARNDTYFPPWLARDMGDAFKQAGGRVEFVMLPPFAEEGHFLFTDVRGLDRWTPVVTRFLNDLGFPGTMPKP
ncbi:MAG: CocE/NonD family hydrolase [Desulfobaccales bacterium]